MAEIKIISNPFFGSDESVYSILYQAKDPVTGEWKNIDSLSNPDSELLGIYYSSGLFIDKVEEILSVIYDEYGTFDERISLEFEGLDFEYDVLKSVCSSGFKDNFLISDNCEKVKALSDCHDELSKLVNDIKDSIKPVKQDFDSGILYDDLKPKKDKLDRACKKIKQLSKSIKSDDVSTGKDLFLKVEGNAEKAFDVIEEIKCFADETIKNIGELTERYSGTKEECKAKVMDWAEAPLYNKKIRFDSEIFTDDFVKKIYEPIEAQIKKEYEENLKQTASEIDGTQKKKEKTGLIKEIKLQVNEIDKPTIELTISKLISEVDSHIKKYEKGLFNDIVEYYKQKYTDFIEKVGGAFSPSYEGISHFEYKKSENPPFDRKECFTFYIYHNALSEEYFKKYVSECELNLYHVIVNAAHEKYKSLLENAKKTSLGNIDKLIENEMHEDNVQLKNATNISILEKLPVVQEKLPEYSEKLADIVYLN